jgi:hypothetical protein
MTSGQILKDVGRLILLVVIGVPVILLLLGPLLIAASVRGRLRAGPVLFDFRHYKGWQRGGVVFLGVVLSALVWGAAGVALMKVASPGRWFADLASRPTGPASTAILPPPTQSPAPDSTYTPAPGSIFIGVTPPPTALAVTPLPISTPTPAPITPLPIAPPPASPTLTPTSAPVIVETPAISTSELALVVPETIERANQLLRLALAEPSADNMDRLAEGWRDKALQRVTGLANDMTTRYKGPLKVTYEYLIAPSVVTQGGDGRIEAADRELWTFSGTISTYTETVEYRYFLQQIDDTWYIVDSRHVTWEHTPED